MEATISSFRRGLHRQTTNQMILMPEDMDKEKAKSLVGKKVSWKSPKGKEIKGEIKSTHGSKGAVRALFETGMPGQAIGTKISIE